jgi:hypothetical protein
VLVSLSSAQRYTTLLGNEGIPRISDTAEYLTPIIRRDIPSNPQLYIDYPLSFTKLGKAIVPGIRQQPFGNSGVDVINSNVG